MNNTEIVLVRKFKKDHPNCTIIGCADLDESGKCILFKLNDNYYKGIIEFKKKKTKCIIKDLKEHVCKEKTFTIKSISPLLHLIDLFIEDL